jgi:hypothetical protein
MATKFSDSKGRYVKAQSKKTRADKSNELKESIGSLDRRVQKALSSGDTDTAKDLRSRQHKFVKELGKKEAVEAMKDAGATQIRRTTDGSPMFNTKGKSVYDEIMNRYFIDPTRNLKNTNPRAYKEMYGLGNLIPDPLRKAGVELRNTMSNMTPRDAKLLAKNMRTAVGDATGRPFSGLFKRKQIPYANPETHGLPGVEFPLGLSEALGTPEAYNLGNRTVANSVDGVAPINVNASSLDLSDGYQVIPAGGSGVFTGQIDSQDGWDIVTPEPGLETYVDNNQGVFSNGMDLLDYFNLKDKLPTEGIFKTLPEGVEILREGYNQLGDDKGFDFNFGNRELEYNKPLWGGNLRLYGGPDESGIFFSKGLGV